MRSPAGRPAGREWRKGNSSTTRLAKISCNSAATQAQCCWGISPWRRPAFAFQIMGAMKKSAPLSQMQQRRMHPPSNGKVQYAFTPCSLSRLWCRPRLRERWRAEPCRVPSPWTGLWSPTGERGNAPSRATPPVLRRNARLEGHAYPDGIRATPHFDVQSMGSSASGAATVRDGNSIRAQTCKAAGLTSWRALTANRRLAER